MPNRAWRSIALCAPLVLGQAALAETVTIPLVFQGEIKSNWTLVRLGTAAKTTDGRTVWSVAETAPPALKDRKPTNYPVLKVRNRVKDGSGRMAPGSNVLRESAIDVDEADRAVYTLTPNADGYFLEITHDTKAKGPMVVPLGLQDSNGNMRVLLYESKMASGTARLLTSHPGYIGATPVVDGKKMQLLLPRPVIGGQSADADAGSVADGTILVKGDNSITIKANAYPLEPLGTERKLP
jgi:hypothetical protein